MASNKIVDYEVMSVDTSGNIATDGSVTAEDGIVGDLKGDVRNPGDSIFIIGQTVGITGTGSTGVTITGNSLNITIDDIHLTSEGIPKSDPLSNDELWLNTGSLCRSTGTTLTSTYTTATPAIELTDAMALLDATAQGVAATLAAGHDQQVIHIKAVNADNAVTLVPASLQDGTTITFDVNEYITLYSDGTSWYVIGGTAAIT